MSEQQQPTFGNGKICYIEVPATDIQASADFFQKSFGWGVRTRGDGSVAFDDGVGQVSGTWCIGPPPATPGFVISIMVDNMEDAIAAVEANGGTIVQPVGAHYPEITAHFADPAGNIWGLYQHRSGS
jgi:predicted enzyme related to lactoylglutathione lyase